MVALIELVARIDQLLLTKYRELVGLKLIGVVLDESIAFGVGFHAFMDLLYGCVVLGSLAGGRVSCTMAREDLSKCDVAFIWHFGGQF